MELSGIGKVEEVKSQETAQTANKEVSDAFSQLFAALFLSIQQSNQIPMQVMNASQEGTSQAQTCIDDSFISMIRNMSPDTLNMLQNGKNKEASIENILKELGITNEQDIDNAIDQLLKANGITVNGETKNITDELKKLIEETQKNDNEFKSLIEQISKQLDALKNSNEKADDKQSSIKILEYIKNVTDNRSTNNLNSVAVFAAVKEEKDINKLDTNLKNNFSASQNNNQEQTALFANKQVNAGNDITKAFEVTNTSQKENLTAFIEKPQDLVEVTVNQFKSLRLPDFTEMRVKLRPEELGEVTVKVILEKGQINGSILADRKEVVSMLQNQIDYLKQELKNSNINLSNITVHYDASSDLNGHNASRDFNQQGKNNGRRFLMDFEEKSEESISNNGFTIIA